MGDLHGVRHPVRLDLAEDLVGLVLLVFGDVERDLRLGIGGRQCPLGGSHHFLERRRVLEEVPVEARLVHEGAQDARLVLLLPEAGQEPFEGDELLEDRQQAPPGDEGLAALDVDLHFFDRQVRQVLVEGVLVLEVLLGLALLDFEERRLRDVDVPAIDELGHLAEEERQQQRPDVAPVHVSVGHQDDLVVAGAGDVEDFLVVLAGVAVFPLAPNAGAERHDQHPNLLVGEHLVEPRLLHVEDLALEGQDGLEATVATLLGGAAGRIALYDEQLAVGRILLGAVGELAGQRAAVQGALAADQLLGLAGRLARPRGVDGLADDPAGDRRVLLEVCSEGLVDGRLDDPLHLAVPQLGLGLALELGVPQLHADDGGEPLADVIAGQRLCVLLQQVVRVRVVVDRAGERRLEADQVGTAFARVDVVGECKDVFRIAVVVLEGDLKDQVILLDAEVDGLVQRGLGLVQVLDERHDPALVPEDLLLGRLLAFVLERDRQALVQEGQLAQTLGQDVEAELRALEDLGVRLERDLGAAPFGLAGDLQGGGGLAALVVLLEDLAVLPDLHLQPCRERVYDRDAHAVEAPRHGVGALLELPAGMEHGEGDLGGGLLLRGVHARRDAPAVVHHRDAAVDMDRDLDRLAEPGHVLVNAVVHHFVHEVVEALGAGAPDVHGGALADGVESLQHLDLLGAVGIAWPALDLGLVRGHRPPRYALPRSSSA